MILFFRNRMGVNGKASFSKGELSQILAVYGEYVKNGEWRDYAIDCTTDRAIFSVFRSSRETPVFAITKFAGRGLLKRPEYAVYEGTETLRRSASLIEVLDVFRKEK